MFELIFNSKDITETYDRCDQHERKSSKTSNESHQHWKKQFQKNLIFFRLYADFYVDNKIDNSDIGKKQLLFAKRNPVCNGDSIVSEKNDVLKSGYYDDNLDFDNVDWFVDEVFRLKYKKEFFSKTLIKILQ